MRKRARKYGKFDILLKYQISYINTATTTTQNATMGNRASTRSRAEKDQMRVMSSQYIGNEIEQIDAFQNQMNALTLPSNAIVSGGSSGNNTIALSGLKASTNKLLEIMKKQLKREDKTLVKADIIAIIISLKPELASQITQLDSYTVKNLNAMLRSIVYDINRIKSQFNMQIQFMSTPAPITTVPMPTLTTGGKPATSRTQPLALTQAPTQLFLK